MLRKMFRGRDGFSNVTSTIILSSVLLIIMITTTYLANDILNIQIAASEFDSAENMITTIDNEIKKLLFKPGSSAVIKASFSTTAPGYTKTGENMNITIGDLEPFSIEVKLFNIDGRQVISGAPDYDLRGDSSLLIFPYNGSLGRIHVSKPRNMRVSLDYERVQCTFTGIVNLFNGSHYVPHNTLELTSIVLDFGDFEVGDNSMIIIQNEKVVSNTFILTGNFVVTVSSRGVSDSIYLTDLEGNPAYDTQVNLHRAHIEISVLGGG